MVWMRNNKGGYLYLSSTMVMGALIMPGGFFRIMIHSHNPTHPPTCRTGVFVETVSLCPHQMRISAARERECITSYNSSTTSASIVMFWSQLFVQGVTSEWTPTCLDGKLPKGWVQTVHFVGAWIFRQRKQEGYSFLCRE